MTDLKDYFREEYNLVSRWWKYLALTVLTFEILIAAVLWFTYDFSGDLKEWYFDFGNKLLMIGVFEK